jgi:DNA polymerase-1
MTNSKSKLLLVDGHSLAYRAFHALPVDKFHSPQGIPVNAVYGLTSMLINLLAEHEPTHLAVCFDEGRNTFRKKLFPGYKANRAASPDEFKAQISLIRGLIDSFGVKSFSDNNYEADDLIATITKMAIDENIHTFIVTSDRDSFQLISDKSIVLYPKKGLSDVVQMNEAELFNKYGLSPNQYPDFAALRGDPSDNLPGIPGVGEKTATTWIQKYGSLDNLIQDCDQVTGKVGESLRANIATIESNRHLTQLVSDIPIQTTINDLRWNPHDANPALIFCTELGFKSLLPKLRNLIGESAIEMKADPSKNMSDETSLVIENEQVWILRNGEVGKHQFTTAAELEKIIWKYANKGDLAVADIKEVAKSFCRLRGTLDISLAIRLKDVLICEYLINPGTRPNLEGLVIAEQDDQLFQDESSNEKLLQGISNSFSRIKLNKDYELVSRLYETLEAPVALALAEMELAGIALDTSALKQMIQQKLDEQLALESLGHKLHGREFNFASPKQLQEVLFVDRGLSKTKKTKTGFTTDAEALEFLMAKHPDDQLLHVIQQWRETSKIKQMLTSLQEALVGTHIHTSFMQTIAATGRLSSTKPNLQNVPIRTEAGRAIRGLFVSEKPYGNLITADYSQIELRVMAHLANDSALIESFKSGEDLHISVASQIFGLPIDQITPELRSQVKAVSYGLAYGLSSYGLSQSLKIDVAEADKLMNTFFERFAGVRDYLKSVVELAREKGYTETILGRRRYLPELNHENRFRREVAERAALNAPIQGSAADIIKLAMVNVHSALNDSRLQCRLLLQVHDELVLESSSPDLEDAKSLVKNAMQNVIELSIPLDVSVGSGKSWLTAAH